MLSRCAAEAFAPGFGAVGPGPQLHAPGRLGVGNPPLREVAGGRPLLGRVLAAGRGHSGGPRQGVAPASRRRDWHRWPSLKARGHRGSGAACAHAAPILRAQAAASAALQPVRDAGAAGVSAAGGLAKLPCEAGRAP